MDRLFSNKKIGKPRQDISGYAFCNVCDGTCSGCYGGCTGGCYVNCNTGCQTHCGYSCGYNCVTTSGVSPTHN